MIKKWKRITNNSIQPTIQFQSAPVSEDKPKDEEKTEEESKPKE